VNYLVIVKFLRHWYPAVAHILTHPVNLVFGPKSGFKNICRTRVGSGSGQVSKLGPFTILVCPVTVALTNNLQQQFLSWRTRRSWAIGCLRGQFENEVAGKNIYR